MALDLRDVVVDLVRSLHDRTELPFTRLVAWLGIARATFYEWRDRYGTVHEHNAWIPRDHWLLPEAEQAILDFHTQHPLEGHQHWHVDIAHLNPCGTFYSMRSVLDRASRAILQWEVRESMKEVDVACILQRARELYPG